MMSPRRLTELTKKWQRTVVLESKRLNLSSFLSEKETEGLNLYSAVAGNGRCVVYTDNEVRFEVPPVFLGTAVFGELLRLSKEELGFTGDEGKITLPCDAAVMEYWSTPCA